jgi:lysozyme family protein
MANFEIADKRTRTFEGGYTGDKDDNGNWTGGLKGKGKLVGTNHGISAPVLMKYLKKIPSVQEMKTLTKIKACAIYKVNYWDTIRGDEITNQDIANDIYDMGVNAGVETSIILAKRARKIEENTRMDDAFLNILNQKT